MILLIVAVAVGFYMAWNIGANDVANAMGTSVGSKSISFRQAVVLAAIFEFAGAVLVGSHVTDTVRKGIIDPMQFADSPNVLILGMLAALIASALWINAATWFGQPVSTSHSIVGSLLGVGIIAGGGVQWMTVSSIVSSWFVSPIASGVLAFLVFRFITRKILGVDEPSRAADRYAPYFVALVVFILTLSFIYKGLPRLDLDWPLHRAIPFAAGVCVVAGTVSALLFRRIANHSVHETLEDEFLYVESLFKYLQIITACYIAFAHGANDVANAVGPLAAIYSVHTTGTVSMHVDVPIWVLVMGGVGITVGLATFGRRVIETVGKRITEITPSRGFTASFAAATTVLVCSKVGLPVSTTHALVGAVIGVGLARGIAGLQIKTIRQIFTSWIATIPITAGLTMALFWLAKTLLG
jgi:PiT family inorganic phosphate transporter